MGINQDASGNFLPFETTELAPDAIITGASTGKIPFNSNTLLARKQMTFAHELNTAVVAATVPQAWTEVYFHAYRGPVLCAPGQGRDEMKITIDVASLTGPVKFRAENGTYSNDTLISTTGESSWNVQIVPGVVDALTISAYGNDSSEDIAIRSIRIELDPHTSASIDGAYLEDYFIPQETDWWTGTDAQPLSVQLLREAIINNNTLFNEFRRVVGCHHAIFNTAFARALLSGAGGQWNLVSQHIVYRRDPASQYVRALITGYTQGFTGGDAGARVRVGFTNGVSVEANLDVAAAPKDPANFQIDANLIIPPGPGPHFLYIMGQEDPGTNANGVIYHYSLWEDKDV